MKRLIIAWLLFSGFTLKAQQQGPNDQIRSSNWDVIGSVNFKVKGSNQMFAIFNSEIKKYANKSFELEGYMIPIKDGMKQTTFMLSTLPVNQCYFCGKNGVPVMVLVVLTTPAKFTYQTITIKGTLKLSAGNAMDNPPIALIDGTAI